MTMPSESTVRRAAKRVGWRIKKSRGQQHLNNRGRYMLISGSNTVVTGADFGAGLEECMLHIERYEARPPRAA